MKVQTGYLYHIKDEFFNVVQDENLMSNHERVKKRPTYFTIKDKEILWFIPLSSKIEKYRNIVNKKIEKFGFCNTILIEKVFDSDAAILLQNAFSTLEKRDIKELLKREFINYCCYLLVLFIFCCIEYLLIIFTFSLESSILLSDELANDVEKAFADVPRFWLILFIFVISYKVFLLPFLPILIKHSKDLLSIVNLVRWLGVLSCLIIGKLFLDRQNKIVSYFRKISFLMYIFHQTFLVIIAYYTIKITNNMIIQISIIILRSFLVTLVVSHIINKILSLKKQVIVLF